MKMLKNGLIAVLMIAAVSANAGVAYMQGLSVPEMAEKQATHVITIKSTDFTVATTNTTELFSNSIPAGCVVNMSSMHLKTAFDNSNTNLTGSCLLTVGTAGTANLLLASTELASDGTEVFNKIGLEANTLYSSVATNVILTFTPNLLEMMSSNNTGEVSVYLRVLPK